MEILKTKFFQSILIELLRGTVTFSFGFISFLAFEKYRNRKDNNKLYAVFLRLIKELKINKQSLKEILNNYRDLENLNKKFMINNIESNELIDLYSTVNSLRQYECVKQTHDENGYVDGVDTIYCKNPHQAIEEIEDELDYLQHEYEYNCREQYYDHKESLENTLKSLEKKNIFDDFLKLQSKTEKFLDMEFDLKDSIIYLNYIVSKFNTLSTESKTIVIDKFCKKILWEDKNEIFINSLKDFNRLNSLKKEFSYENKETHVNLSNVLWTSLDTQSIAIYDAELYLELEDKYLKLNELKILKSEIDSVQFAYEFLEKGLEKVLIKSQNKIKKRTKTLINKF